MTAPFLFIFGLGFSEVVILLVVGILLFGRRLPEVGRKLGKTFVEIKGQLNQVQSELKEVDRLTEERLREKPRARPVDSVARGEVIDVDDLEVEDDEAATESGDSGSDDVSGWQKDAPEKGA